MPKEKTAVVEKPSQMDTSAELQNSEYIDNLTIGVRAAWPATFVETIDHQRLIIDTRTAVKAASEDFKLYTWDASNGLMDVTDPLKSQRIDPKATRTPLGALQHIADCSNKSKQEIMGQLSVFLMLEFNDYLHMIPYKAEQIREVVRNCLPRFKNRNLMYVFQGASITIPASLRDYIKPMPYPRPDANAMLFTLEQLIGSVRHSKKLKTEPADEFKRLAARAALGLTATNAEATFARAAIKNDYKFNKGYVHVVSEETKRGIREEGLVEVVDAEGGFNDQIAGYETAKGIIADDIAAFAPEARLAGVDKPTGCLLGSRAGCGKSQLVKATAGEFDSHGYSVKVVAYCGLTRPRRCLARSPNLVMIVPVVPEAV